MSFISILPSSAAAFRDKSVLSKFLFESFLKNQSQNYLSFGVLQKTKRSFKKFYYMEFTMIKMIERRSSTRVMKSRLKLLNKYS